MATMALAVLLVGVLSPPFARASDDEGQALTVVQTEAEPAEVSEEDALAAAIAVHVASDSGRFEVELFGGTIDREACLTDPACMSALADQASARFILWGELGEMGDRRALSLELFDTRTGVAVGRESVQVRTDARLVDEVPKLVTALLARVEGLELARGRAAKILVVPVGPPLKASNEEDTRIHRPGLIALTGATGASALVAALSTAGMFAVAMDRDARAAEAVYQVDAAPLVEERNAYALGGMMAAATTLALGIYPVVGATYWLLEER